MWRRLRGEAVDEPSIGLTGKGEAAALIDKENEETTQLYLWGNPCAQVHPLSRGLGAHADQIPLLLPRPQEEQHLRIP